MDEKFFKQIMKEALKEELEPVKKEIELLKKEINSIKQEMMTKGEAKAFATKEDLRTFATKEDYFNFETRISSTLENIREGVRISLFEVEQELREIKSKLRFYDFDYITRLNDAVIKALKELHEEKTFIVHHIKELDDRLVKIEQKLVS